MAKRKRARASHRHSTDGAFSALEQAFFASAPPEVPEPPVVETFDDLSPGAGASDGEPALRRVASAAAAWMAALVARPVPVASHRPRGWRRS